MNRLTERRNGKLTLKRQFPTLQDTFSVIMNRLELYEDLEEQGLLVKLPFKVNDTVYFIRNKELQIFIIDTIKAREQISIHGYYHSENRKWGTPHEITIGKNTIGRKLFITREEAEKALNKEE